MIFKAEDYYGVMADECKLTLVEKFTYGRPKIEIIRAKVLELIPLKGKVRIGAYDYRHVFIKFTVESDFNEVYFRRFLSIKDSLMRVFKWSTSTRMRRPRYCGYGSYYQNKYLIGITLGKFTSFCWSRRFGVRAEGT